MKFEQLRLLAVGPFTDTAIEFAVESPKVHLVYGPNEAGKSSALRAIVDLLYGFPAQTSDDFLHAYGKLRVGAKLRLDSHERLEVVRRKANKGSLRDGADEKLLDDELLQRHLAGVGRELFLSMFGLDHARLRKGGREMVEGGGKAGETLFAAAAGLSKLRSVQQSLLAANDELFKSSSKNSLIRKRIEELTELRKQQVELQASPEQWNERDQRLADLKGKLASLDEELLKLQSERRRLQRIQSAALPIGRRRQIMDELARLAHVPVLPLDFSPKVSRLRIDWGQTKQAVEDRDQAVRRLRAELESLPNGSDWLTHAETIESLYQEYGSRRSAAADRPKIDGSRAESERHMQSIVARLGIAADVTALHALYLPADKKIRIQTLANQRDGLLQRLQAVRRECENIRREIAAGESSLAALSVPKNWETLDRLLEKYRVDADLEEELDQAERELDDQVQACRVRTARLKLIRGESESFLTLPVPGLATIDHFDERYREIANQIERLKERLNLNAVEQQDIVARIEALNRGLHIPSEADLAEARRLRDAGWELILINRGAKKSKRAVSTEPLLFEVSEPGEQASLEAFRAKFPSALSLEEAYRQSVLEADRLADAMRLHAEQVATKAGLLIEQSKKSALEDKLQTQLATVVASEAELREEWKAQWNSCGIDPLSPREMREWLDEFQAVVEAYSTADLSQRRVERSRQRVFQVSDELSRALEPFVGVPSKAGADDLKSQLNLMEDTADRFRETAARKQQIDADLHQDRIRLEEAESQLREAETVWTQWQSDWAVEMERLRLDPQSLPAQANVVLDELDNLRREEQKLGDLKRRIDGIDRDALDYEARVRKPAALLLPELADASVDDVVKTLHDKLRAARDDAERREVLNEKLIENQRLLDESRTRSSELDREIQELLRLATCAEFDQLPIIAAESQKKSDLENRLRELEEEILVHAQTQPLDDFIAEVAVTTLDDLPFHLSRLDEETKEKTNLRDDLLSRIAEAKSELSKIDGNAVVAILSEKGQSLIAEISEHVQNLAVQRLATSVLTTAMERYREKNQGPVLGMASEYFRTMTNEAFKAVSVDFDERGEPSLHGVRSDGSKTRVNGMSDGTCDQLFLALRFASLDVWLDHHPPLPFIVDDILLNFDDDRSLATLRVLEKFAQRTQVLFFTHHAHTVELAKNAVSAGGLEVVNLKRS